MKIQGKQLADILRDENNPFEELYADSLVGDLNGAIHFEAKNVTGAEIAKGVPVYINGISGDGSGKPTIAKADATASNSAMPAFGLTATAISNNSVGKVTTFGTLEGLNTSAFSEGDILYVDTTAGQLTNTAPTGSGAKLQNIGIVLFSDASTGAIRVGGAGRTNATPNLDNGKFFIGDSNNQSSQSAYGLPLSDGSEGQILVSNGMGQLNFADPSGGMTYETKSANFTAEAEHFYFVDTTAGNEIQVTLQGNTIAQYGDRVKIFNRGAGTVKLYEGASATSLDPYEDATAVGHQYRYINSKSLIEAVCVQGYPSSTSTIWAYVIIPQIELDAGGLTTNGEFLTYNTSELALKPAPYAMPTATGTAGQVLAVSSSTNQLEFATKNTAEGFSYVDVSSGGSATVTASSGPSNFRLRHGGYGVTVTDAVIYLPRVVEAFGAGNYFPDSFNSLHNTVMEIVNESSANLYLKVLKTKESSSKNSARTTFFDSTGQVSPNPPTESAYQYAVAPRTRIYLMTHYSNFGGSNTSYAELHYVIV